MVVRWCRLLFSVGLILAACGDVERKVARCAADDDCSRGVCDPTSNQCVECLRADDCGTLAACEDRKCVPRVPCKNGFDCKDGQVCGREEGYCAECFSDFDCPAGNGCVKEECRPRCASDKDCVERGLLCDVERRLCVDCVEDHDCPPGHACSGGACMPEICAKGQSFCSADGTEVRFCSPDGTAEHRQRCDPSYERCVGANGYARCEPYLCEPNSVFCSGDSERVRRCSDDGATADTIEDCKAQGKACDGGECRERICEVGEGVCVGDTWFICSLTETRFERIETCGEDSYCDPEFGGCVTRFCTPGHKSCSLEKVVVCNSKGSAYEEVGACDEGETCSFGACVKTCEPGKVFCKDGHPWKCSEGGDVMSQVATCKTSEFCDAATGSCKAQVCTPNSKVCDANVLRTCDALGSSYTVKSCGSDSVCLDGQCHPKICDPNQYFCGSDGNPYLCNATGTVELLQDTCDPSAPCTVVASGSGAFCASGAGGHGGDGG
jgi:hypothetical protein